MSSVTTERASTPNSEYYWDCANATAMGQYLTRVEWSFIEQSLREYPGIQTILDIGGGSGRFAMPLHEAGYKVVVTEVNPLPLSITRRRVPQLGCILTANGDTTRTLPLRDASLDCVLCIEVFALIDDGDRFFAECHRVLREGGLLIIAAENRFSYKGFLKKQVLQEDKGPSNWVKHSYASNLGQILSRLRNAGFQVQRVRGFNWAPATRVSNSRLVSLGTSLERMLFLDRAASLSPWTLTLAQRPHGIRHTIEHRNSASDAA